MNATAEKRGGGIFSIHSQSQCTLSDSYSYTTRCRSLIREKLAKGKRSACSVHEAPD
jgi:hypothetical protein